MLRRLLLPNTSLSVSQLCLGTNQFGTGLITTEAKSILDTFFASGGNFIDTAHSYGDWIPNIERSASERTVGSLLKGRDRASYVLATKGCEFDYRAGDFALRVNPDYIERDLISSIENLDTDYIDLYWLHRDDPTVAVSELVDALIHHQQAGRISYFGCSNWSPERIAEAQGYARSINHEGFVAVQPMWGLARPDRQAMWTYAPGGYYEDGYQPLHEAGLTMIPYSGQSRGVFTKLDQHPDGSSLNEDVKALFYTDENLKILAKLRAMSHRKGVSINDLVLAYMTSQPCLTVPIVGASSADQLNSSINSCVISLSADELTELVV